MWMRPEPLDEALAFLELEVAEPIVRLGEMRAVVRERSRHAAQLRYC
jgi:hypothetical protein